MAFQEFFVIPTGASSFSHAMAIGCEVFHNLKAVIKAKFGGDATLIGDEGGFAPPCSVDSGLEMLMEAIDKAGHSGVCTVGLDVASSEFKVAGENAYDLDFKTSGPDIDTSLKLSGDDMLAFYQKLGYAVTKRDGAARKLEGDIFFGRSVACPRLRLEKILDT